MPGKILLMGKGLIARQEHVKAIGALGDGLQRLPRPGKPP
jgi:hypothetical protein